DPHARAIWATRDADRPSAVGRGVDPADMHTRRATRAGSVRGTRPNRLATLPRDPHARADRAARRTG
ncbi:hypothetical protein, partial [Streptomyces sp.]|uniref:hypothetical protein n=1 Tax=Streptomyces sp. TaxID=1931 RepID=UPI002D76DB0A